MLNVVDSSGWLEYFADGPNAGFFAPAIESTADLVVPVVCLFEVFKRIQVQRGEGAALKAVAAVQQGRVLDISSSLAITAASLSCQSGLPMAGSLILAAARSLDAELWTQDKDFEGLPGVRFTPKSGLA